MLPSSAAVKSKAKTSLKTKWPLAIIVSTVFLLTYFFGVFFVQFFSSIDNQNLGGVVQIVIAAAYWILFFLPLFLGVLRWFWCITGGHNNELKEIFVYFSSVKGYVRTLVFAASFAVRIVFCAIVVFLPAAIANMLSSSVFYGIIGFSMPLWSANLPVVADFLEVIGVIMLAFLTLRLYLSPLLLVIDDDMHPGEAFHISILISRDFLMNFIILSFSFCGWFLLSLLAVPLFYTLPLFIASFAVHGRFAINYYNTKVKHWQQNNLAVYREQI